MHNYLNGHIRLFIFNLLSVYELLYLIYTSIKKGFQISGSFFDYKNNPILKYLFAMNEVINSKYYVTTLLISSVLLITAIISFKRYERSVYVYYADKDFSHENDHISILPSIITFCIYSISSLIIKIFQLPFTVCIFIVFILLFFICFGLLHIICEKISNVVRFNRYLKFLAYTKVFGIPVYCVFVIFFNFSTFAEITKYIDPEISRESFHRGFSSNSNYVFVADEKTNSLENSIKNEIPNGIETN